MIYLDFDGVMLAGQDYLASPLRLPAPRVQLLQQLLDHTGSKIVLSSKWRIGRDGQNMLRDAGLWKHCARRTADGNVCNWKTPVLPDDDNHPDATWLPVLDDDLSVRGQEIQAHIDQYKIGRYVILDDDAVLAGQHHVQVNAHNGLTQADIDQAIKLWDMQN